MNKNRKVWSLVDRFEDTLNRDCFLCGPVADYHEWVHDVLCVDLAMCSEECDNSTLCEAEGAAWKTFHDSIEATSRLMDLYKEDGALFRKIASGLSVLPCLMSWHPNAAAFNRQLLKRSGSGENSICGNLARNAAHLARQSWPVRYAYAIIWTIDLTLGTDSENLAGWAEMYGYGVEHAVDPAEIEALIARMNCGEEKKQELREEHKGAYRVLPKWTKGLTDICQPLTSGNVLSYWRKGKEIIMEEMPDFHLRPEWKNYCDGRAYANGPKKGAIQHAIFKDILVALKTIAKAEKIGAAGYATIWDDPP